MHKKTAGRPKTDSDIRQSDDRKKGQGGKNKPKGKRR
jgi:hypothetical protein